MVKIKNQLGRNFHRKRKKEKLTPGERSALMAKIRSKKTVFELNFFRILKKQGISFRAHPRGILGKPDFFIKEQNLCVFLDSDFWHGWQYPRWKHLLKNNFWRNKIERNRRRDRKVVRILSSKCFKVVRIWEHQIKSNPGAALKKIYSLLG